jgi:hypothetical protein
VVQVDYAKINEKWKLPNEWYSFSAGNGMADFVAFDTARLMWDNSTAEQKAFVDDAIANSTGRWLVAYAHHPYLSDGEHGNAGNYEGLGLVPIVNGANVKDFLDDSVCGKVDIYFSGHDHNRQAFAPVNGCQNHFVVSGAGAKTTDFVNRDGNTALWKDDQLEGFAWVEITCGKMTLAFYDLDGNLDHEFDILK